VEVHSLLLNFAMVSFESRPWLRRFLLPTRRLR
jgi:hypothetical protein